MGKPKNPVAASPLLRKGGVHSKSKSGERSRAKTTLRREVAILLGRSVADRHLSHINLSIPFSL